MLKKMKTNRQSGFTIVEVMIVMAIAGLILLIVFLAVPALQRNSRNTQRKNDVSALLAGINEYVVNNNGAMPTAWSGGQVTGSGTAAGAKLGYYTAVTISSTQVGTAPTTDTVTVVTGGKCNTTPGTTTATGAATRQYAAVYVIENGSGGFTAVCQDS